MRISKVLMIALAIIAITTNASAQAAKSWQISKIAGGTGVGILSTGLNGTVIVERSDTTKSFEFSADASQAYVVATQNFGKKFSLAATGGILDNTPFFGPKIDFRPIDRLTLTTWPGWSIGKKFGVPSWNVAWGIKSYFADIKLVNDTIKGASFTVNLAALKFETEKMRHIAGGSMKNRMNDNFDLHTSAAYDFTRKKPMYQMGTSWHPAARKPVIADKQ